MEISFFLPATGPECCEGWIRYLPVTRNLYRYPNVPEHEFPGDCEHDVSTKYVVVSAGTLPRGGLGKPTPVGRATNTSPSRFVLVLVVWNHPLCFSTVATSLPYGKIPFAESSTVRYGTVGLGLIPSAVVSTTGSILVCVDDSSLFLEVE